MIHYILEAQQYTTSTPRYLHVGYVNHRFNSREEAREFYHEQYPGQRDINRDGDWISDWSRRDGLRFVIVPFFNQNLRLRDETSDCVSRSLRILDEQIQLKVTSPEIYSIIHDREEYEAF